MDLFDALIKLRPEWGAETLKVVMTGGAEDGPEWQRHIGNKEKRRKLANRFKDDKDTFRIVTGPENSERSSSNVQNDPLPNRSARIQKTYFSASSCLRASALVFFISGLTVG